MTFKQFESFINAIKSFYEREKQLSDALEPFNSSWSVIEFCPEITSSIFEYLKDYYDDRNDWIGYWFFELKCGTRTDLAATYADGSPIKLDALENLWLFLLKTQQENANDVD